MKMSRSCKGYQKMVETQQGERAGEGRTWVSVCATVKRWLLTRMTAGSDTGWRSLNDHVIPEWWHSGLNWVCSSQCVTLLLLKQTAASRKLPNHSDTTSGRFYGDSSQDHRVWCLFVLVCVQICNYVGWSEATSPPNKTREDVYMHCNCFSGISRLNCYSMSNVSHPFNSSCYLFSNQRSSYKWTLPSLSYSGRFSATSDLPEPLRASLPQQGEHLWSWISFSYISSLSSPSLTADGQRVFVWMESLCH